MNKKEHEIGPYENCEYNLSIKFDQNIDLINKNLEVAIISGNAEMIRICMRARKKLGMNYE